MCSWVFQSFSLDFGCFFTHLQSLYLTIFTESAAICDTVEALSQFQLQVSQWYWRSLINWWSIMPENLETSDWQQFPVSAWEWSEPDLTITEAVWDHSDREQKAETFKEEAWGTLPEDPHQADMELQDETAHSTDSLSGSLKTWNSVSTLWAVFLHLFQYFITITAPNKHGKLQCFQFL